MHLLIQVIIQMSLMVYITIKQDKEYKEALLQFAKETELVNE